MAARTLAGTVDGDRVTVVELDYKQSDNWWRVKRSPSKSRGPEVWGPRYVKSLARRGFLK